MGLFQSLYAAARNSISLATRADHATVTIYLNGVRALTKKLGWNKDDTANDGAPDVVQENANFFSIAQGQGLREN